MDAEGNPTSPGLPYIVLDNGDYGVEVELSAHDENGEELYRDRAMMHFVMSNKEGNLEVTDILGYDEVQGSYLQRFAINLADYDTLEDLSETAAAFSVSMGRLLERYERGEAVFDAAEDGPTGKESLYPITGPARYFKIVKSCIAVSPYWGRSCQNATALAAATLRESTPLDMGIMAVQSHRAMVSRPRPSPSVPRTTASLSAAARAGSSMDNASSRRAMATVRKPRARRRSIPGPGHWSMSWWIRAQGTWKTVPMLTRTHRRYRGSVQAGVRRTPSIPRAAADRKMAPRRRRSPLPARAPSRWIATNTRCGWAIIS